ncbi:uncharacterized protein LOC123538626 [Mercenaria mercenaria]|uniref:uncharacterized protein LOC123538626 n=1 Tax=Mercenaria mercenaria TaxID=6596 RepID=UPI001E1DF862|nr:uncharacterized protein LOC123538626 [Mercenaria mercenaria]
MKMNTPLLLQLSFAYYLSVTLIGSENFKWQYFHCPGNAAIAGDEVRTEVRTVSRLDCLSRCISCQAVGFNEDTKECRHYMQQNSTIIPMLNNAVGPRLWISQRMKLSAAQSTDLSQMMFEEAAQLCRLLGGRLATYRELSNARQEGFHLCCCGWLSDRSARFVLHHEDSTCEHQQTPGLHTCKIFNSNGQRVYDTQYGAAYCAFTV